VKRAAAAVAFVLLLAGCGDDGGDDELVQLLQDDAHQSEAIARCIAGKVDGNDAVDRDELESIIRGDESTDTETATAYSEAALQCAQEQAGEIPVPGVTEGG
jgi:hypothetical protein